MNTPAIPTAPLIPRAIPRWFSGKASVSTALALAKINAPPTPSMSRTRTNHSAPPRPVIHVIERRMLEPVKMAKPRLYMRTRPNMSPTRPRVTTSTEVTSR